MPRRLLNACSLPAALLLLNLYFCQDLFRLKYSVWMGSIEAAFISISRYMLDNWRDLTWFPLWYGGIPFQNAYPPLLHALVAAAAGLSGASPARAHHAVTAAFYALGPLTVYWLALRLSRSRWPSFWAALGYSIFSPSIFLAPAIRNGMSGYFELRRFFALVPYGEGPHIAALALLPLAILALDIALERRRPMYYVMAALAMDAVALSNWIGAFALALALLAYLTGCQWGAPRKWATAAATGALAYALACTWIPPSTIADIRYNAQLVGDFRAVYGRLPLYAVAGLGMTLALGWLLARWNISGALRFFVLFAFPAAAITLSYEWLGAAMLPQPNRYHLEMDLALCAAGVLALYPLASRLSANGRAALAAAALALCIVPIRLDRRRARRIVKPIDIAQTVEYRSARWLDSHMRGQRVFVPGTISYWLNAFTDNPQLGGGFDQGIVNRELRAVQYQIYSGEGARTAAEGGTISGLWLRAYGVSAVEVGDANSREQYKPFRSPERFDHFAVAFQDGGDAIRRVRETAALAFVIPADAVVRRAPENGADVADARRYVAALDAGAARFEWTSRHSASIQMAGRPDQRLSVQIAYHPGWRATVDGGARAIERDGLGQMVIQPGCGGACVVILNYDGGLEMGLARAVSWTSFAACLLWIGCYPLFVAARLPAHLRLLRAVLERLNYHYRGASTEHAAEPFDPQKLARAEAALRELPMPDAGSRAYLEKHIPRLARTLALAPSPGETGRVLELGCYMQITPLLARLCGYREVRGAYFGTAGRTDRKTMRFPDGEFSCLVDHFDAERDRFPYPGEHFDLVIAGEILEHLTHDPMHMLLEARRVLREGGHLLVTTPNVGSVTSAAKTLDGRDNPQIFFLYKRPGGEEEIGHVREYTAHELGEAVKAAGFEVERLFTTFIAEFASHRPLLEFLAAHGYSTENRGEQSWCLAVKRGALPVDRYPWFIYSE